MGWGKGWWKQPFYRSMGFVSMASITGNPCRGDLLMELQLE